MEFTPLVTALLWLAFGAIVFIAVRWPGAWTRFFEKLGFSNSGDGADLTDWGGDGD